MPVASCLCSNGEGDWASAKKLDSCTGWPKKKFAGLGHSLHSVTLLNDVHLSHCSMHIKYQLLSISCNMDRLCKDQGDTCHKETGHCHQYSATNKDGDKPCHSIAICVCDLC